METARPGTVPPPTLPPPHHSSARRRLQGELGRVAKRTERVDAVVGAADGRVLLLKVDVEGYEPGGGWVPKRRITCRMVGLHCLFSNDVALKLGQAEVRAAWSCNASPSGPQSCARPKSCC